MKLIDRYLLRELFKLFFGVLIMISTAFVIQRLIFLTEWSMHRGVGMLGVLKLLGCLFPGLFLTAVPIVSLFVIIIVLSHLSEDNELVVMMTTGRDIFSLAKPVLVFSLISTFFTLYLALFLTPASLRWFEIVKWQLVQSKSEQAIPTQTFVDFAHDSQIYIQDKDENGLKNLIIFSQGESDVPLGGNEIGSNFIFAKRARIENQAEKAESRLRLDNGVFISHADKPDQDQFVSFEKAVARLDFEGADKLTTRLKRQLYTADIFQLVSIIQKPGQLKLKKKDIVKFGISVTEDARIELSQRISQILSCLLLALWGIGLGIKPPRTNRTISYILGALAGFGFYYMNVFFKALALKKYMPIEPALFSPVVLILLTGAWLMQQRMKGREPLSFLYNLDEYLRQKRAEKKPK